MRMFFEKISISNNLVELHTTNQQRCEEMEEKASQ